MSTVTGCMSLVTCHAVRTLCDTQEQLYVNKCITLFSRWPFFAEFKAFLSTIYRLSLSKEGILPLERYHTLDNSCQGIVFTSVAKSGWGGGRGI